SHVLTLDVLHNSAYYGNSGLGVVRPLETTTNYLRRAWTIGVSDRHVMSGKLLETTVQWTRDRDSDLAKGKTPMEIRPELWSGNFFSDRIGNADRVHAAQTVASEKRISKFIHRVRAGGEFDWVKSNPQLERRSFRQFDENGNLKSLITFSGA